MLEASSPIKNISAIVDPRIIKF